MIELILVSKRENRTEVILPKRGERIETRRRSEAKTGMMRWLNGKGFKRKISEEKWMKFALT